jgi:hypothetical protein
MQGYDNKLQHFVAGQVPEFVSADHPMFVAFMEAYFEWLQTNEEGRRLSPLTLLDQRDIDNSLDSFVSLFREEYLKHFPQQLAFDQTTGAVLDERKLMKHIRAFYKAKGTEKAYRFLFLILFNTYAEVYSPKVDILRLSDGKWNTLYTIKTTSTNGRKLFQYNGGTISQRDSYGVLKAYANIKNIIQYAQGGYEVTEYTISPPFGKFTPNAPVQITNSSLDASSLTEIAYTVLTGFDICDTGEENVQIGQSWRLYRIGDEVVLYPKNNYGFPEGSGGSGLVSEINYLQSPYFAKTGEIDTRGPVKRIKVVNGGVNYNPEEWKAKIISLGGRGTEVTPVFGAVVEDYGFYSNDDGHLSSKKKLQDNRFYQDFSYVVKTDESLDRWINTIRKLIHPSGMAVFAQQYLYRTTGYRIDDKNFVLTFEDPIIGHYTPYRFKTYENLRNNSQGVDLYPYGYNPLLGTAVENGIDPHDSGQNPLSEGLIQGTHNIWCLDSDHNSQDYDQVTSNNITGGCTGTEELQAKHETWELCTGTGPGCCLSQNYWIVYSHPNSRGYTNISPCICIDGNTDFTRFSYIKLNDFFHMIDGRYYHSFVPGSTKFDGFETDDFVPEEASYAAGKVSGLGVRIDETLEIGGLEDSANFKISDQGQNDNTDSVSRFRPR